MSNGLACKKAIIKSYFFCIIGDALCAGSMNIAMLVTCRFIQGIDLGQGISLIAVYLTKVAIKDNRGLLGGLTTYSLASRYAMLVFSMMALM
jgi:predicted MFS family arabinose efflux permease